ncbi:hypothetical protein D3C81_1484910 [compost metagenome]
MVIISDNDFFSTQFTYKHIANIFFRSLIGKISGEGDNDKMVNTDLAQLTYFFLNIIY